MSIKDLRFQNKNIRNFTFNFNLLIEDNIGAPKLILAISLLKKFFLAISLFKKNNICNFRL